MNSEINSSYGFFGAIHLLFSLLFSKILFSGVRLIRLPFYIRGRQFIEIGKGFTSGVGLRIDAFHCKERKAPQLIIGSNCQFNDYVHIGCVESVEIGNDVLIASKVFITDHNHGDLNDISDFLLPPQQRKLISKKVKIGDRVWIGESVMILPGVMIGDGVVIGAGSVVTKSIPSYSIAVGSPAKVIRQYNPDDNL